jgi:hypothetical protein
MHASSTSLDHRTVQSASPLGRGSVDLPQQSSRFNDGAVSPRELHFVPQSPSEASPECSPFSSSAFEPAIFSFSTSHPRRASHFSDESLRHLILKARARRRVQAQLMREKLCLRELYFMLHEWRRVVAAATTVASINYVTIHAVTQRSASVVQPFY